VPRPCKLRRVDCNSQTKSFKPCSSSNHSIEKVTLSLDEFEAIRLADFEGLYQEQAAGKMGISRQTFGNIIISAHKKVADFLIHSKQLTISGGTVEIKECTLICISCHHEWSFSFETKKPIDCPQCKSSDINCLKKHTQGLPFNHCWRTQS
jgi:predicted DNA-binding protein (UPF0251 family)